MGRSSNLNLAITATPFQPSKLSVPVTPFSPKFPITPPATPPSRTTSPSRFTRRPGIPPSVPPPKTPLNWVWQCHICHVKYALGTTRRCLEDGHYFCAGTTVVRTRRNKNGARTRMVKKHRACASEFDYQGWKTWGDWRRNEDEVRRLIGDMILKEEEMGNANTLGLGLDWQLERELRAQEEQRMKRATVPKKDCWGNCDYPSECRWGAQLQQTKMKEQQDKSVLRKGEKSPLASNPVCIPCKGSVFEEDLSDADAESLPATTFDGILSSIDAAPQAQPITGPVAQLPKEAFWNALLSSASRRKSVGSSKTASSPLALSPVIEMDELESSGTGLGAPAAAKLRRKDSDTEMSDAPPVDDLVAMGRSPSPSPPSSPDSPIQSPEPVATAIPIAPSMRTGHLGFSFCEGPLGPKGRNENTLSRGKSRKKSYVEYVGSLRKMGWS